MPARIESIDAYMRTIGSSRITCEEEKRLAVLMRSGTPAEREDARNRLITSNLRLVVKIAHDYKSCGLPFPDLVAEGNLGLMTAVSKFDPCKGKFSVYAAWWIKQAMWHAVHWQSRTIRVPSQYIGKALKLCSMLAERADNGEPEPSVEEMAAVVGMSLKQTDDLAKSALSTVSLDEQVNDDGASFEQFVAAIPDGEAGERNRRYERLDAAIDALSELEQFIVRSMFGLDSKRLSIAAVAQETGLCQSDVKWREDGAIIRLRRLLSGQTDDELE